MAARAGFRAGSGRSPRASFRYSSASRQQHRAVVLFPLRSPPQVPQPKRPAIHVPFLFVPSANTIFLDVPHGPRLIGFASGLSEPNSKQLLPKINDETFSVL